jgi:hypothetical protein
VQDDQARADCYQQIRSHMKSQLRRYYQAHPERQDERGKEAVRISLAGLERIFEILNGFEIGYHAGDK